LFAIQSVSGGWPMTQVVNGSLPFAIIISLFSYLLFMFPEIALWLPRTINNYH
jgi:TRAP-type C4-dicarboxylate transport system permease large subunit